jgi:hypothetical protein
MSHESQNSIPATTNRFAQQAEAKSSGLFREFGAMLMHNKKWWLLPIVLMLLMTGLLVILSNSAFAPFIYPLF